MPGVDNPYVANTPQSFTFFDTIEQWFTAQWIPISDIDDAGRVNPAPLMRVEARQKGTANTVARTDAVLSNSKDFHCRECHAKGQIAANPDAGYTVDAFHSSPSGLNAGNIAGQPYDGPRLVKPDFVSVADMGGNPDSIFDQEYAAHLNYNKLHQYYDGMEYMLLDQILLGDVGFRSYEMSPEGQITAYELITYKLFTKS
jgi:hypothetical protein